MASDPAQQIVAAIQQLDDDAKAAIGKELAPHIPVTMGRRQALGMGLAAALGAGGAVGGGRAVEATVGQAAAADGLVGDIDVLQSGDGTPMGFGNAVEFDHEAVNSAGTIGNVTVVYYDSALGSFTLTIPSSLEQPGMVVRFIDETGNADTNPVTVEDSSNSTVMTIDASDTMAETWWDTGAWVTDRFIPTVEAGQVTAGTLVIGGTLYEEDENSPIDVSGVSSHNYTVSGDYDHIVLIQDISNVGFDQLQVNGDTGPNYSFLDNADSRTTGQNEWTVPRDNAKMKMEIYDFGDRVRLGIDIAGSDTGPTVGGNNSNIGGNGIDQFTLSDSGGSNQDSKMRVYGRNI